MKTITRGAVRTGAAAVLCAPLLLGGCTIGDAGRDGGDAETAAETATETAAETTEDATEQAEASEQPAEEGDAGPGEQDYAVGDCVADVEELEVVDCAEPHAGEVYAQQDVEGKNLFPGSEELGREAGAICGGDDFTAYVGMGFAESSLDVITMMPSKETWAQEDRTVTCVVTDPNLEEIDGTLEQSWR